MSRLLHMHAKTVGLLALFVAWPTLAQAERPTEGGGFYSFDETDVLQHWDEPSGRIRVHFSVDGPNRTLLEDIDEDGVPDFAQLVGTTTAEVFTFFETDLGFLPPVPEAEFGLEALGGSPAFDVYLLDFGGKADGGYRVDTCEGQPARCVGFVAIENDFAGYGYASLDEAVHVLTSHELFHAVQAAYAADLPVWLSEGTAVWAERQWDHTSRDFLAFANAYLRDVGRSVNRPPGGPVPAFAYGTGLWFDFMTAKEGPAIVVALLEAVRELPKEADALAAIVELFGGEKDFGLAWQEFVAWNLATGSRAGQSESHSFAASLAGIEATATGANIDREQRFFPIAASYFHIDHAGGPLYFGVSEAAPNLRFGLHPVVAGAHDGPVDGHLQVWSSPKKGAMSLVDGADLPAGGYWLWGTKPVVATNSTKVRICIGSAKAATACGPLEEQAQEEQEEPGKNESEKDPSDGGGCNLAGESSRGSFGFLLLLSILVAFRRSVFTDAMPLVIGPRTCVKHIWTAVTATNTMKA